MQVVCSLILIYFESPQLDIQKKKKKMNKSLDY